MSFLGRVAARASAGSPAGGAAQVAPGVAVPAMASTSPLVAHDQRLTLPGFSDIAPGRAIGESGASEAPEGEPSADAPTAGLGVGERGPAAEAPIFSPTVGHENAGPAFTFSPVVARGLSSDAGAELAASSVSLRPDVSSMPTPLEAFSRPSASPSATDSLATLSPAPPSTSSERVALRGAEPTARITVRDVAVPSEPATGTPPTELEPAPRTVLDAVARLDKWLRTDAGEGSSTPSDARPARTEAATPAANVPVLTPTPRAEAAESASFAAAPSITIGKLEIEVVPPAPKARLSESHRAPERRARSVSRGPSAVAAIAPRSFGWRQR
jgi:hypothetical protein